LKDGVRQEIVSLAVPVVCSTFLQRISLVVDTFLVGGLGAVAITTVGIGQMMTLFVMTVVWGLSAGTTVVIAQLWGAQRYDDARTVSHHVLKVGAILGLGISVAGIWWGQTGAVFLGASEEVLSLVEPYLLILFSFITCSVSINLLSAMMYGVGDARPPLHAAILMNVVHIGVAYPLIHGLWGAPRYGVLGVAIATAVSETVGAAYLITMGLKRRYFFPAGPHTGLIDQVLRIGFPVAGERALQQAGQFLFLKVVMLYGTAAYAAHQVGMAIEAIAFLPGLGISMAVTTAVGQRLGARQVLQASIAHREANRLALWVMAGMGALFFAVPGPLLRVFTTDQSVIALGTSLLKIVACLQVPLAITMVLYGSLRGAGDTSVLFWSTVLGSWGVRVPLAWLFAIVFELDLIAVWSLLVADWLVRMAVLTYRYRSDKWHAPPLVRPRGRDQVAALVPAKPG
jgi:putative MATE family efflux protein